MMYFVGDYLFVVNVFLVFDQYFGSFNYFFFMVGNLVQYGFESWNVVGYIFDGNLWMVQQVDQFVVVCQMGSI